MVIEIIATIGIVALAFFIFIKNLKKKASGKCDCSSCTSKCARYNENNKDTTSQNNRDKNKKN
ncbi:FeoB-associated Cys-rich membrane protein [Clostridium oceanicum]|uniref:Virus attachment protein p12 family protein n=1 Tax=Clostridium oceanicum TaxID=1543 RepID=A0ABP3UML3_9CLOT